MKNSQAKQPEIANTFQLRPDFKSFKFFMEWSNKLQFTNGFAELHNMILEAVKNQSPFNNAWIFVTDPENNDETYLISNSGGKKDELLKNCPRLNMNSDPMLLEIKESHRPVIVEDARTDPRTNKEIVAATGNITIVNIPITLTGELVGLLGAGSFGEEGVVPPSQETIELMELLSHYLAPVIVRILENEKQERYTAALLKAKKSAEKSMQVKTEFLENISHELKTPLHAISGFVELLDMDKDDFTEDQRSCLSEINNASTQLLSLIENVLDFESAESGELEINNSDVNIINLLQALTGDIQNSAQNKCITITDDFEKLKTSQLFTDERCLKKIIHNLLNNAVEFNRENGTIHISAETLPENRLKIAIKDTGIGIPEDKSSQLFSPFSRINTNADTLGAGISLAVSKQLTESLGGQLKYESAESIGSIFWIEMPIKGNKQGLVV